MIFFKGFLGKTNPPHKEVKDISRKIDEEIRFYYNCYLVDVFLNIRIFSRYLFLKNPSCIAIKPTKKELKIFKPYHKEPICLERAEIKYEPYGWYGFLFIDTKSKKEYTVNNILGYKTFKEIFKAL